MTGRLQYLELKCPPGESDLGEHLQSKVIPTFFFDDKSGEVLRESGIKSHLYHETLNAAVFLLLLFLLQRHVSSLNPLSKSVSIPNI